MSDDLKGDRDRAGKTPAGAKAVMIPVQPYQKPVSFQNCSQAVSKYDISTGINKARWESPINPWNIPGEPFPKESLPRCGVFTWRWSMFDKDDAEGTTQTHERTRSLSQAVCT